MKIPYFKVEEIFAHARRDLPNECCGLLGGRECFVNSVYQLKNVAANPLIEYEAATEELFRAQKQMRERGEDLIGIYHSHPRSKEPFPSQTDIKLAFYSDAIYFIVGFDKETPVLRAFKIYENQRRWEQMEFVVIE